MPNYICQTCGTQYAESSQPPERCPVCEDERQYVGLVGQKWTTMEELRKTHRLSLRAKEAGPIGLGIDPKFGNGQRALFLRTPEGNILWDCISLIDEAVVEAFRAMGGLKAIAISHPHYYTSMVDCQLRGLVCFRSKFHLVHGNGSQRWSEEACPDRRSCGSQKGHLPGSWQN
jgi:hypothetical protein